MDIESVRIEALKLAILIDKGFNPIGTVSTAKTFESYIIESESPKRKPGRPPKAQK